MARACECDGLRSSANQVESSEHCPEPHCAAARCTRRTHEAAHKSACTRFPGALARPPIGAARSPGRRREPRVQRNRAEKGRRESPLGVDLNALPLTNQIL